MDDLIEDELQIMEEQSQGQLKVLSGETFETLIEKMKLMSPICFEETTSLKEVIGVMQDKNIGSIMLTHKGKLTGIFTERDVLRKVIGKVADLAKTSVKTVMTPQPTSLLMSDKIAYVMNNMHVGGYRHVPIVDESEHPVAIVSIKDVLRFILDYFPENVLNITDTPYRGPAHREGA